MGCTLGHQMNRNQRMFRVYNVDRNGVTQAMGRIEITEEDLILHQKGKDAICWPLRSLRRYGFDAELFSFESGRRCPTGQGIYAFKCQRAEALFNLLQECIQRAGQEDSGGGGGGRPASVLPTDPPPSTRPISQVMDPWNESPRAQYINSEAIGDFGGLRPGRLEGILNQQHQYVNTGVMHPHNGHRNNSSNGEIIIAAAGDSPDLSRDLPAGPTLHYAQLDLPSSTNGDSVAGDLNTANHNAIITKDMFNAQEDYSETSQQATYINVAAGEGRSRRKGPPGNLTLHEECYFNGNGGAGGVNGAVGGCGSLPTPPPQTVDMNYIQVDVSSTGDSVPASPAATQVVTSYNFPSSGASSLLADPLIKEREDKYAVIDFDKTYAINAKNDDNEGVRKTRHNSNLEDCT